MTTRVIAPTASWPQGPIVIDADDADIGTILTCTAAGYSTFQWYRDGTAIPGATSSVYVVTEDDLGSELFCRTGRDSMSIPVAADSTPSTTLTNTLPPSITAPTGLAVGATLHGDAGEWVGDDPITFTYRWMRCDATGLNATPISGATSINYTLVSGDLNTTLRLEVTADDGDDNETVTSARTGKVSPLLRGAVIAASRGNAFGQSTGLLSSGTELSRTYGQSHVMGFTASGIRLLFGNYGWGINDAGHTPNALTGLRASVKIGSTLYPVTFNASSTATLAAGAFVLSDPVDVSVNAGTTVFTYVCPVVGTLGQKWCIDLHSRNIVGEGSTTGDVVDLGTVGLASGAATFSPVAICADNPATPQPVVVSIGTSIDHGVGDSNQDEGFVARAFDAAGIGVFRQGYRSQALYQLVANMSILDDTWAGCTHALVGDIINDVAAGRTLTQVQASITSLLNALSASAVKVVVRTTTPDPNLNSGLEATRVAVNQWVRGLGPNGANSHSAVVGVFDAADATETSTNSGLWKPGYTADNVHPTAIGHAALAAALDLSMFTNT